MPARVASSGFEPSVRTEALPGLQWRCLGPGPLIEDKGLRETMRSTL